MIFTEKKITINNDQCKIDSPVVLYRGDYNVEVRFTIVSSPYKYSNKQETNVTESTEASFGQLIIKVPNSKPIFSDVTPVESDGAIIFTIKKEMIDESIELGEYDFQIRLFDENQQSRATIPPVIQGIHIKEPIAIENETNVTQVNYGSTSTSTPLDSFDSDGNYIETSWKDRDLITDSKLNKIEKALTGINNKAKDIEGSMPTKTSQLTNDSGYVTDTEMRTAIENKDTIYNSRLTDIETKNTEQDNRLDIAENRLNNIGNDITNTMQPIIDEHTSRLDAIEAIDVAQNNRLDVIEAKNTEQDDRLLDVEKVNKRQDIDIKCLYGASQTIDIAEEGNNIYLQNSNNGFAIIDDIKGNTLVNCNKEPNKELILNGNINTSGDNTVTLTEGVNGGLVDVALEGNTLVNVSKTKDTTALPLDEELTYLYANTQYTVQFISDTAITADITLGGTSLLAQSIVAGLNRISITTPETLVDNKLIINGVGANISEVVVTQATDQDFGYFEGMKSVGECEGNVIEILSRYGNLINYIRDPHASKPIYYFSSDELNKLKPYLIYFNLVDSYIYCNNLFDYYYISEGTDIWLNLGTYDKHKALEVLNRRVAEGMNKSNTQQLTHEPLRAVGNVKDRYVLIDGKWYIERKCGYRNNYSICDAWSNENLTNRRLKLFKLDNSIEEFNDINILRKVKSNKFKCVQYGYTDGRFNVPFLAYITENGNLWVSADINYTQQDMLNYINDCQFVYELQTPTYESIDYNPLEVYSSTTHITTNSTIPANIIVKNHGFNCLLKPSTTYTISSNLGLNTVTTPSTPTEDCLRFMDTDTSDVTTMKDVLVLEGDWTTKSHAIPANFSGIESAFEQEYDAEKGKYKVNIKVANEDKTKENNITFYINEPLRGVGDTKDKVFIKDGKVVVERNCTSVTFDGSDDESWVKYSNNTTEYNTTDRTSIFLYTIIGKKIGFKTSYCDNFSNYGNNTAFNIKTCRPGVYADHPNYNNIYIDFGSNNSYSVNDFKQWLQQNPTKVVYALAEPTYEEIEYNDTKLFIESFKNSTLSYNSNVPVTSKLYYSYSVPLVDKVAQTSDISDQQDQLIIDMATQCAIMEMYLM